MILYILTVDYMRVCFPRNFQVTFEFSTCRRLEDKIVSFSSYMVRTSNQSWSRLPDWRSRGRGFKSHPWLLCTNVTSVCHHSGVS